MNTHALTKHAARLALVGGALFAHPALAHPPPGALDAYQELDRMSRWGKKPQPPPPAPARMNRADDAARLHTVPQVAPPPAPADDEPLGCGTPRLMPPLPPAAPPEPMAVLEPPPPGPPPVAAPPPIEEPPPPSDFDAPLDLETPDVWLMAEAVCAETNAVRAAHGLKPLAAHGKLDDAAAGHADRMAKFDFFDHEDPYVPHLRTPSDRLGAAGVSNPKAAENIATESGLAIGSNQRVTVIDRDRHQYAWPDGRPVDVHTARTFAESVVARWMDSPGHRRNILAVEANSIGCGVAQKSADGFGNFTAVQVFQWFEPPR